MIIDAFGSDIIVPEKEFAWLFQKMKMAESSIYLDE